MPSDVARRSAFKALGFTAVLAMFALTAACGGGGQVERPQDALAGGPAAETATSDDAAARGRYLVSISGCNDCHTPWKLGPTGPEPDMSRYLAGHSADMVMPPAPDVPMPWAWVGAITNTAFAGPWGVSYAINLTSDDTGIGLWSEQVFVNAMKTGRHMGVGRPIMPPMPWPAYSQMTTEDLRAMFAYLKTVAPIQNQAPAGEPAEPPPGAGGN